MATVYKAKDLILNRYVAVKILRDEFTTDEEFIKRFNIEAQAAASLTHPNIVSVYDVGHEENLYFIVMELVKGKTLKEIIVEDGALGWKWSVKVAMQIASGLERAHRNNIVHRDIKPHNIIITEDGVAKVTDFGIAKAVSNSTITAFGTTIGSVHYFSPEHARGGYTDAKSDLYSLGVVMYEMVTGRVPFDSDTPVSVALKHMQEEPIQPIEIKPDLPKSVNDVIMKAMKKNTEERYQTATEMLKDLEQCLKNPEGKFASEDTSATRIMNVESNKTEAKRAETNKKPNKMSEFFNKHKAVKVLAIIALCITVFIAAIGITLLVITLKNPASFQIPDFTNMTLEEAEVKAKELKIKLVHNEEKDKYHPEIEEGKIIEQDPKFQNNYTINEGSTVKVGLSKGQEIVKIPEKLVGKTRDEAYNALKNAKFEVQVKTEYSDKVEKGYTIKVETEDQKEVTDEQEFPAGTIIILHVSEGIEQVEVPDLSGKTESEAKAALTEAKLKWKSTEKISDSDQPNGVVYQSVSAGSLVDKDTEVTIKVNEFQSMTHGTININVASLQGYTEKYEKVEDGVDEGGNKKYKDVLIKPKDVEVIVTVDGEQVEDRTVGEDTKNMSVGFDGKDTVTVKVVINGSTKATKTMNLNTTTTLTIE